MVEPLSVAWHAATRTPVERGTSVLVTGVGTIGMLTLQVAKSMGAHPLIAADVDDAKLALALRCGAAHAVNTRSSGALEQVRQLTGGGADVAFDAVGIEATVDLCMRSTVLGGRVVLIGNLAQQVSFPLQWAVTRQLTVFGSCASAGEYPQCLDLIRRGLVDVRALVSRTVPLSEGALWIQKVYDREEGINKIVLEP